MAIWNRHVQTAETVNCLYYPFISFYQEDEIMIFDGHIHITEGDLNPGPFLQQLHSVDIDGGIVVSIDPPGYAQAGRPAAPERVEQVVGLCDEEENLFPFFWIDPLEDDASEQISMAVEKGINGFKVICDRYLPENERAMAIFRKIADAGFPIMFHSGILWDGKPSSHFNRPAGFECLLDVKGLRFSLAHISWPWVDECIAVYGKFLNAASNNKAACDQMFIDTTPGTPEIYRMEALTRLFTVGYEVKDNVWFGTDSRANGYNAAWARTWVDRDREILKELKITEPETEQYFSKNLLRFVKGTR